MVGEGDFEHFSGFMSTSELIKTSEGRLLMDLDDFLGHNYIRGLHERERDFKAQTAAYFFSFYQQVDRALEKPSQHTHSLESTSDELISLKSV